MITEDKKQSLTSLIRQRLERQGKWFGSLHVWDDGRPSFSVRVDGDTRHFISPYLGTDCILANEFMYARAERGLRVVRSDMFFDNFAGGARTASIVKKGNPDKVEKLLTFPASVENLRALTQAPMVPEVTIEKCWDLIFYWESLLPKIAFFSILLKAGSIPASDDKNSKHRLPALTSHKLVKKRRSLTEDEKMALILGQDIPLTEDVKVSESDIWEHATEFQKYSPKYKLYSQQLIGAWAIWELRRVPLWYDMRVGKTWSAIAPLVRALREGEASRGMVVCPTFNMYDPWVGELESAGLTVSLLDGTVDEDIDELYSDSDVVIVNYERLSARMKYIEDAVDLDRLFLIADETSAIKNYESKRAQAMHHLCRRPEFVVLLNGTPLEQGPQDIWSQMRCIDSYGVMFGQKFWDFANKHLYSWAPNKFAPNSELDFQVFLSRTSIRYIRSEADQFAGRDKTFRYVQIPPTKEQIVQTENVLSGFLETVSEGAKKRQEIFDSYLVISGFLREISCGYDKFRECDESPYRRVRHRHDSKIMWALSWLMSRPDPAVIYCEFNEQESRLKETLDKHGISWASTSPKMKEVTGFRLIENMKFSDISPLVRVFPAKFRDAGLPMPPPGRTVMPVPNWLRYDDEVVKHFAGTDKVEKYTHFKKASPYPSWRKSEEVGRFNSGEVRVFICKWSQARGFSLARKEAVKAGIGVYPTIISMAPTWSLGSWRQGQDRCVATHTKADGSQTNINTMVYALTTGGSIEMDIMQALRSKANVADTLFEDAKRKGFETFVTNMMTGMKEAAANKGSFDAQEMQSRIDCGVPPFSKLTKSLIINKISARFKVKGSKAQVEQWALNSEVSESYCYLLGKVS